MRESALPTLEAAIEWMVAHWNVREMPVRLHSGGIEPLSQWGAPRMAHPFVRYLDAHYEDRFTVPPVQADCLHPDIPRYAGAETCQRCFGSGKVTIRPAREEYRYPMWRAMVRLSTQARDVPPPIQVILMLVETRCVPALVTRLYGIPEGGQLRAIRRLHSFYETGPLEIPWTQQSEAQQNAQLEGVA